MTLILPAVRVIVATRARNRCEYCQLDQDSQVATFPVDHVVPRDRGGLTNPSNLALACTQCNALKWIYVDGTDTESGLVAPLFNPRTDEWNDHFRWSEDDLTTIEPLTAIGRITVALLLLNSVRRVEIRKWLRAIARHPPGNDP